MITIKVGIVGPELLKWPTQIQIEGAERVIAQILQSGVWQCPNGHTFIGFPALPPSTPVCPKCNSAKVTRVGEVTLVSGGCPKGGVDIWSERKARSLKLAEPDIRRPDVLSWPSSWKCSQCGFTNKSQTLVKKHQDDTHGTRTAIIELKGYMSRNIDIAKAFAVGYCIAPVIKTSYCSHHEVYGHPTNGGCWTTMQAERYGKEIHLLLIDESGLMTELLKRRL